MSGFYRFLASGIGIYEAVDRECPRSDLRRTYKPDGAWLPRVGEKFPGAISFWTEAGLKKYLDSGLQEWHRSVITQPIAIAYAEEITRALYSDELQAICSEPKAVKKLSWEEFARRQGCPIVEKVVAYIVSSDSQKVLVFEHDKKWSEAGVQVPAGTVDANEEVESAALREAEEECGLRDLSIVCKLDDYLMYRNTHTQFNRRHVYLMRSDSAEGKEWTHSVQGDGVDKGMNFHFYWLPLKEARYKLAGSFGSSIDKLEILPLLKMADADPDLTGFVDPDNFRKVRIPIRDSTEHIVGFATPRQDKDDVWRMGAIYVKPEYRGKGLARTAIQSFMYKRKGRAFIENENIASQKAYEAAGFSKKRPDDKGEGYWWENY